MDAERAQRITKTIMVVCFAIAFVTLLGELLGWWNDVGEIVLVVTTIVGAVGGIATVLIGSSSDEVRSVHDAVRGNGGKLDAVRGELSSVDGKLDKLDSMDAKLDVIEDALVASDGRTSRLDVVQTELDRQTGVLDNQVSLLTQIRDRL